ncbi:DUF125-domain-containing protein [Tilletiaria anomala UBC 951]|uniref:DUF125-domain-containing protein n=1 Tax=Tilletiaria anomala (strain ATCC 24038 / CBS 436.72 / UBC 951) TaxID=1037660 RepID=A0A066WLD5_TILAU|nr:DUF125-domain-containing protein [Tilletiaria anomala UBC 951]KDN51445.1 DUF125-domain-containing protein [Tilletiaria anomala UBC 951]
MPCAKPCANCACAGSAPESDSAAAITPKATLHYDATGASQPLPARSNRSIKDERTPLLWETSAPVAGTASQDVEGRPLVRCDRHSRHGVCCRELKGTDDRSLISPDTIRDYIIGLSDGLTVPFALTAGLSSVGSSRLVVIAGLAELIAGAVSMGIGGFLSAQAEGEHYKHQERSTAERVARSCDGEIVSEVLEILQPYGVPDELAGKVASALQQAEARKQQQMQQEQIQRVPVEELASHGLTPFLLRLGQGLEPVSPLRSLQSAVNIGAGYAVGGIIPLAPYMIFEEVREALYASIVITAIVLLLFGVVKHRLTGGRMSVKAYAWSALTTLAVGGMAAASSWAIVRALEGPERV